MRSASKEQAKFSTTKATVLITSEPPITLLQVEGNHPFRAPGSGEQCCLHEAKGMSGV